MVTHFIEVKSSFDTTFDHWKQGSGLQSIQDEEGDIMYLFSY